MAKEEVLTYLQDVLDAIDDMQSCFIDFPNRYDLFEKDIMRRCVVERKVEIMGEAINRIRKIDSTVEIPNARAIIDTRNRIIHAYDNVQPDFLWSLVIRHIPELKKDIERVIVEYEELYNSENKDWKVKSERWRVKIIDFWNRTIIFSLHLLRFTLHRQFLSLLISFHQNPPLFRVEIVGSVSEVFDKTERNIIIGGKYMAPRGVGWQGYCLAAQIGKRGVSV